MEQVCNRVLEKEGRAALQYSATDGYLPLREKIAKRSAKLGFKTEAKDILITAGSQQGLDFCAKIFINEGDVIICESPSYLGAINAFKAYQPQFVEIPMDDDGMIVTELEKALKEHSNARMIYTIPDFQNPSGKTMSVERRKKVAKLAKQYSIPVLEDGPYSELAFEGNVNPSIKSFDEDGYVIYLGTFSKTFCPGLRIGWVCADPEILQKYIIVKQGADLQCSTISQREIALFMKEYDLNEHINNIKEIYKRRRDVMLDSIEKYFPSEVKYTRPKGGLFTWVQINENLDAAKILEEALKYKVAFVPGGSFFPNGGNLNHFRLNYSNMNEELIVEGMKRLGNVLQKCC
jgi:2-aminoadipate transaminase